MTERAQVSPFGILIVALIIIAGFLLPACEPYIDQDIEVHDWINCKYEVRTGLWERAPLHAFGELYDVMSTRHLDYDEVQAEKERQYEEMVKIKEKIKQCKEWKED